MDLYARRSAAGAAALAAVGGGAACAKRGRRRDPRGARRGGVERGVRVERPADLVEVASAAGVVVAVVAVDAAERRGALEARACGVR